MVMDNPARLLLWQLKPSKFFEDITGLKPIPKQAELLDSLTDFNQSRILVSNASSTGKTLTLALAALWSTTVLPTYIKMPYKVMILSGSMSQSDVLYSYFTKYLYQHEFLTSKLKKEPLKSYTPFNDGSDIIALAASPTAYHGPHVNMVIVDEAEDAGKKDERLIMDAPSRVAGMPYARVILSSTPYWGGLFWKYYSDTLNYPTWKRYHWTAQECGWIDKADIEWAKHHLPDALFQILWVGEYAIDDTPSLFRIEDIHKLKVLTKPEQLEGKPIYICVDWGQAVHPSAVLVIQKTSTGHYSVLDAQLWKKVPYPEQLSRIEALAERFKPEKIYADGESISECERLKGLGLPVVPVSFRKNKPRMIETLRMAIEEHRIRIWEQFDEVLRELAYYNPDRQKGDDFCDSLMMVMMEEVKPSPPRVPIETVGLEE
jgi:hypothetical protein